MTKPPPTSPTSILLHSLIGPGSRPCIQSAKLRISRSRGASQHTRGYSPDRHHITADERDRYTLPARADAFQHIEPAQHRRSALGKMVIKIRLARFGRRNLPTYNIVVAQARYAQVLTSPPSPGTHIRPIEAASRFLPMCRTRRRTMKKV